MREDVVHPCHEAGVNIAESRMSGELVRNSEEVARPIFDRGRAAKDDEIVIAEPAQGNANAVIRRGQKQVVPPRGWSAVELHGGTAASKVGDHG